MVGCPKKFIQCRVRKKEVLLGVAYLYRRQSTVVLRGTEAELTRFYASLAIQNMINLN